MLCTERERERERETESETYEYKVQYAVTYEVNSVPFFIGRQL